MAGLIVLLITGPLMSWPLIYCLRNVYGLSVLRRRGVRTSGRFGYLYWQDGEVAGVFRFEAQDGKTRTAMTAFGHTADHGEADTLDVLYDPTRPQRAEVADCVAGKLRTFRLGASVVAFCMFLPPVCYWIVPL
ncbi:hypothetical protein [Streptomyces lydicus]|uniref:hypothetical protein n=1 Tax=Streptomyces lydicus TaxID=47763 RepID=UPI0037B2BF9B